MNKKYQKILLLHTGFIGDVILVTPLIRAVKELFPSAAIDIVVIPQTADVLKNNPHLRSIVVFDKRRKKLGSFVKTVLSLRRNKYELGISAHNSFTSGFMLFLGHIRERIGFYSSPVSILFTYRVITLKNIHRIQKNLHLLSMFSTKKFDIQTELFPSDEDWKHSDVVLKHLPFKNRPCIAIAPGSVWATKRWPKEYYVDLCNMLFNEQMNLIFIGSKEDRDLCSDIIYTAKIKALNLAGTVSILTSAAVISRCRLIVCNDSGALHIANAMKVDVFAFFGPTVPSLGYFPFRDNDLIFEINLDCRPCGKHGHNACPLGHHKCMKEILPKPVFQKILNHLGSSKEAIDLFSQINI